MDQPLNVMAPAILYVPFQWAHAILYASIYMPDLNHSRGVGVRVTARVRFRVRVMVSVRFRVRVKVRVTVNVKVKVTLNVKVKVAIKVTVRVKDRVRVRARTHLIWRASRAVLGWMGAHPRGTLMSVRTLHAETSHALRVAGCEGDLCCLE